MKYINYLYKYLLQEYQVKSDREEMQVGNL